MAFRIRFSQCVAFKTFAENVGNVLEEGHFEVQRGDAFEGIVVEGIDALHVCMVLGRIAGVVEMAPDATPEERRFCVRMATLLSCLRNAHPQNFLELSRDRGSTDLKLHIYEPDVATYTSNYNVRTLAKEPERVELEELLYDYYVEMDLAAFRTAIKTAKEQRADATFLKVFTQKAKAATGDVTDASAPTATTVVFAIVSKADEVESSFPFQSSTVTEESSEKALRTIRASESSGACLAVSRLEDFELRYSGSFSTEYLFKFVKSMERHALTLRLAKAYPLVVEYPLGCDATNYLRFVLASKLE